MALTEVQEKLLENKRKIASRGPRFNPREESWRVFITRWRIWAAMAGLIKLGAEGQPIEFVTFTKLCIASCMQETAVERIRPFNVGNEPADSCTNIDQYIVLLGGIFQPPAESRTLKQEFLSLKQAKTEDVSTYLSSKVSLYDSAYSETLRDFETLLSETIRGLYSDVIKRRLRNCDDVKDRTTLRTKLFDLVAKERESYMWGYAESTSLEGLVAVAQPGIRRFLGGTQVLTGGEEAMEVDALIEQKIAALGIGGKYEKKDPTEADSRKCYGCNKPGHLKRNCPNKPKPKKSGKSDEHCGHCNYKGHTIEDCRKRKADKAEAAKRAKGIGEITDEGAPEEAEETDSKEEVQFLSERGVYAH